MTRAPLTPVLPACVPAHLPFSPKDFTFVCPTEIIAFSGKILLCLKGHAMK